MTIDEKFRQGKVLYKNDEGNYVLELWGGSTKHPDSVFHMEDFEMAPWVDKTNDEEVQTQIFQWLCECASKLTMPFHAVSLVAWAMENYTDWNKAD